MTLTLEDIADMCGVSRSTVSRVINGDLNVSERTRQKVLDVIQKYNFQPNLAARGLAMGHTRVLGLVIPKGVQAIFEEPFFAMLIQGVSTRCNALDYSVMLWLAEPDYERRMITKILYNGLVDGVIVASMLMDDTIIDSLRQSKLPFILIGRHPVDDKLSYLDVDNRGGACQAVLHLLRSGSPAGCHHHWSPKYDRRHPIATRATWMRFTIAMFLSSRSWLWKATLPMPVGTPAMQRPAASEARCRVCRQRHDGPGCHPGHSRAWPAHSRRYRSGWF